MSRLDARIYQDLKRDHDKQRTLLKKVDAAKPGSVARADLFVQLKLEIASHAAAEEESLYATMLADPELRDDARHSVAEHKEVADYLAELEKLDNAGEAWTQKFAHMRQRYEHHIDEEERDMFPAAEKELDAPTEARLAETYEERKPAELARAIEHPEEDKRE